MTVITNIFGEYAVDITIPRASNLTRAQRSAIRQACEGENPGKTLTYTCAVAEAANEAFGAIYNEARERVVEYQPIEFPDFGAFRLSSHSRAHFGLDQHGHIYLTIGLRPADEHSDVRYKLIWRDGMVPQELAEIAVKHDRGQSYPESTVTLSLADAELHLSFKQPQTEKAKAGKEAHEVVRKARGKRVHRRVAACDIERVY